jgi:hypothetical protein
MDQRDGFSAGLRQHESNCDRDSLGAQHPVPVDQFDLLLGRNFTISNIGAGEAGLDPAKIDIRSATSWRKDWAKF